MSKWIPGFTILIVSLTLGYSQDSSEAITGLWYNEPKDAKIKVYKKNGAYYGKIVWLSDSVGPENDIRRDVNNDDKSLQNRPLIGLNILQNMKWDNKEQEWNDGKIYDPRSGNTYSAYAKLVEPGKLKLRGYIGFSLLGRTTYWERIKTKR